MVRGTRFVAARATLLAVGLSLSACAAAADPGDSGTDPDDEEEPPPQPLTGAAGVSLGDLALYQGVKRPIVEGGQPATSTIPIVASRDALLRVFVQTDGSFAGALTGRLYLGANAPIEATSPISTNSDDANLTSTLNFEVPGDALQEGAGYRLEVGELNGAAHDAPPLAYPAQGTEVLPVSSSGDTLKIMLVPIQYDSDGSGRLPDTSEAQVALYQQGFAAMYPVPHVEITVHAPMPWGSSVQPFGNGWDSLLDALAQLRASDGVPPDVYYYGPFAPANSIDAYCGGGCVAGLGITGGPTDAFGRAAIGLGFTGEESVATALHEVGHNHGRLHSPCQTNDADPAFPYPNGSDGVWGYDRQHQHLFPPTAADIMGYCQPSWISDWTFVALFDRIRLVNGVTSAYVIGDESSAPRTYDRARLDAEGQLHALSPVSLATPPRAEPIDLRLSSSKGALAARTVTARLYGYDHLPGGMLVWDHVPGADVAALASGAGNAIHLGLEGR